MWSKPFKKCPQAVCLSPRHKAGTYKCCLDTSQNVSPLDAKNHNRTLATEPVSVIPFLSVVHTVLSNSCHPAKRKVTCRRVLTSSLSGNILDSLSSRPGFGPGPMREDCSSQGFALCLSISGRVDILCPCHLQTSLSAQPALGWQERLRSPGTWDMTAGLPLGQVLLIFLGSLPRPSPTSSPPSVSLGPMSTAVFSKLQQRDSLLSTSTHAIFLCDLSSRKSLG
jgi:hypothetical protein